MDIVQISCRGCGLSVTGRFGPTALARLSHAEQAFVTAFVRVHGNIKKMERLFGVSYPTIKKGLNELAAKLDAEFQPSEDPGTVLERIERGELSVADALQLLD